MKTTMIIWLLLFAGVATAQDAPMHFFSHQDIVKPSMDSAYTALLRKVKDTYREKNVNMNWNTFSFDDNSYVFFSPVTGLDVSGIHKAFAEAEGKVGKDAYGKLWSEKADYIESHNEFVTASLPQFNYLAPAQTDYFRRIMFWFPLEGKEGEAHEIAKEWIQLHQSKNAPQGYQTFRVVFGGEPGWAVLYFAKDELDFATKSKKNSEVMGKEAGKLWARTLAITKKIYYKNGWFRPDLSYHYEPAAAR